MAIKTIKFRGKTIRYRNTATLARKLRISRNQAEQLERGNNIRYAVANGNISKIP